MTTERREAPNNHLSAIQRKIAAQRVFYAPQEIGKNLGLSEKSVTSHLGKIYSQLEVVLGVPRATRVTLTRAVCKGQLEGVQAPRPIDWSNLNGRNATIAGFLGTPMDELTVSDKRTLLTLNSWAIQSNAYPPSSSSLAKQLSEIELSEISYRMGIRTADDMRFNRAEVARVILKSVSSGALPIVHPDARRMTASYWKTVLIPPYGQEVLKGLWEKGETREEILSHINDGRTENGKNPIAFKSFKNTMDEMFARLGTDDLPTTLTAAYQMGIVG